MKKFLQSILTLIMLFTFLMIISTSLLFATGQAEKKSSSIRRNILHLWNNGICND